MKKTISLIIMVIFAIALLAGCGGGSTPAASGGGGDASQPAQSGSGGGDEVYSLNFSFYGPEVVPPSQFIMDTAKVLEEKSNGRLTMDYYFNGTLLGPPDTISGCINGTADIVLAGGTDIGEVFPLNSVYSMPYMTTPPGKSAIDNAYGQLQVDCPELGEELAAKGLMWLTVASANGYHLHGATDLYDEPSKVKGRTINGQGEGGNIITALGGNGVSLPVTDIYLSLSTGMLDGALDHFGMLEGFSLKELLFTHTVFSNSKDLNDGEAMIGGGLYSSPIGCLMNINSFNNLPADLQQLLLDEFSGFPQFITAADASYMAPAAIQTCVERGDDFVFVTDAERGPWVDPLTPIIDAWAARCEAAGYDGMSVYNHLLDLFAKAQ